MTPNESLLALPPRPRTRPGARSRGLRPWSTINGGCVVDSTTQFYSAASEVLCSTLGTAGRIGRCQFAVDVRSTGRWPVTPHGYGIQFGFFFLLARVQPV
jgi:hypothetical protein